MASELLNPTPGIRTITTGSEELAPAVTFVTKSCKIRLLLQYRSNAWPKPSFGHP